MHSNGHPTASGRMAAIDGPAGVRELDVLVVGGGVAGLEALLALNELGEGRLALTLVARDPEFVYKPLTVEEPFLVNVAERQALAPLAEQLEARFVQQAVVGVRPEQRTVELGDGSELGYDVLVMCAGGRLRAAFESAYTFPPVRGRTSDVADWLRAAGSDGGGRLAFVVPPGVSWPLPIYELALMTRRRAKQDGIDDLEIEIVTPESAPLVMFGRPASQDLAELLRVRRIGLVTGAHAHEEHGRLVLAPGDRPLEAGAVVALPALDGPGLPGLPSDDRGFIPIDEHAQVPGVDDVYAAGDGTTFPIKQGGIGTQQADAAAEHIAARAGAAVTPRPFRPILRGKLLVGDETLSMLHDVTGGAGEGAVSADCLWWPPHKVGGRYLAPWLSNETVHADAEPPRRPIDVEVEMPVAWHEQPMALDPYTPLERP